MTGSVEVGDWVRVYAESHNRVAGNLMGIRRRRERGDACLKVLVSAAASLTSRAPAAISAPSADHATSLAEIAGAAWAAREVISGEHVNVERSPDPRFVAWLSQRFSARAGQLAPALMAASDGEMESLLQAGAAPELKAGMQAGRPVDADWLVQPSYTIEHAATLLAELNAAARPLPPAVHQARAKAIAEQLATTGRSTHAHITAHAWAVHHLTGIYGSDASALRESMLRFVATNPPHERATLQASKVAVLLSDALGPRARMALLDHILLSLGPAYDDPSVAMVRARDSALVLLLLDATVEPGDAVAPAPETAVTGSVLSDADHHVAAVIAEIAAEAERAVDAGVAERQARYQRAVDAGSLAGALAVVGDAVADDDHEQAWTMLQDIARRHPDADPVDLVTVAPNVLGPVPVDGDADFDGPGAGCFTVLSPVPAQAAAAITSVAPRLLNVDDRGVEHPDAEAAEAAGTYTPNYLHDILWCDRGVQVTLDTKGAMSAPMGRTMVSILTHALIDDRVPALVAGWIPALDDAMVRWDGGQ